MEGFCYRYCLFSTVVGVNHGCKKLSLMLHGSKSYVVVGQLGIATDTYNETGQVTDERPYGKSDSGIMIS